MMPCIMCVPKFVTRVELDVTCSCVTEVVLPKSKKKKKKDDTENHGFLSCSEGLQHVDLSVCAEIADLGPNFLYWCNELTSVAFPPICSAIESIKPQFMRHCIKMKCIDLSPFTSLTTIGDNFLNTCQGLQQVLLPQRATFTIGPCFMTGCKSLESIDLNFMRHNGQEEVPEYFLTFCDALTAVDLEPLSRVHTISESFLRECKSLESVDLSMFVELTNVAQDFLCGCEAIQTVILPLQRLGGPPTVGHNFLCSCKSLRLVDISWLTGIVALPSGLLLGCTTLQKVDLTPLADVIEISGSFLAGCKSLTHVDLPFTKLQETGGSFLADCSALRSFSVTPELRDGKTIVNNRGMHYFLSGCENLESIDFAFLANVTDISNSFLRDCNAIQSLDLSPLSNITRFGHDCINCAQLAEVNFSGLTKVGSINCNFLRCPQLKTVHGIECFSELTFVNNGFMSGCASLTSLGISTWTKLRFVGSGFLSDCSKLRSLTCPSFPAMETELAVWKQGFLKNCTSLELVDLRFIAKVDTDLPVAGCFLEGCDPSVMNVIVVAPWMVSGGHVAPKMQKKVAVLNPTEPLPDVEWSVGIPTRFSAAQHQPEEDGKVKSTRGRKKTSASTRPNTDKGGSKRKRSDGSGPVKRKK